VNLEPSWLLNVVLVCALAALYLWYLAAEATLFDRVFAYPREHWGALWNCPWCLSAWTTAIMLIATQTFDPITWLAAAGTDGFLGSKAG
jgi:hypothetical protein